MDYLSLRTDLMQEFKFKRRPEGIMHYLSLQYQGYQIKKIYINSEKNVHFHIELGNLRQNFYTPFMVSYFLTEVNHLFTYPMAHKV